MESLQEYLQEKKMGKSGFLQEKKSHGVTWNYDYIPNYIN